VFETGALTGAAQEWLLCSRRPHLSNAGDMSTDSIADASLATEEKRPDHVQGDDPVSEFAGHNAIFLLGAGASFDGGLPLSRDITRQALDDLERTGGGRFGQEIVAALRYVCGALIKYDTDRGGSPTDLPDIERLVSAAELLSQRDQLEVSPFVAAWDAMVDQMSHSTFPSFFDRDFKAAILSKYGRVEDLLRRAIRSEIGKGNDRIWGNLHLHLVNDLRKRVHISDISTFSYLEPLVVLGRRAEGVTIATLNYDLSIDRLAERLEVPCDTGIQPWIAKEEMAWRADGIQSLKLHGRVGWSFVRRPARGDLLEEEAIVESDDPLRDNNPPAVVFGQREKLRARGPFLEILGEFQRRLAQRERLVVVGYSFQDEHVNEIIRRWANGDVARRIAVIDPGFPTHSPGYVAKVDFRQELLWGLAPQPAPGNATPAEATRLVVVREGAREGLGRLLS
jgi:hypothetical protein